MAEQILSQVEVDALLKGLSNGDIRTEAQKEEPQGDVITYDFTNQARAVRGRMPALEMVNEKFCRGIRNPLFNLLRKPVDVAPDSVKTMTYAEFLRNLKVPSSLNIFTMLPLRAQGVLTIDPNLVFMIVDSYFGGDGKFQVRVEGRDFTNVEQTVVRKAVNFIFNELNEVWKSIHPVDFNLVRTEMNPQFVNIIAPSELVVVSAFKMEIETVTDKLLLCIPYSSLEPIKEKIHGIHSPDDAGDRNWDASLREQIGNVPVSIRAEIGTARIRVTDLLNLKAGDVVQLDRKSREPADVFVEGVLKFNAKPGISDNNYSLQILSAVTESED